MAFGFGKNGSILLGLHSAARRMRQGVASLFREPSNDFRVISNTGLQVSRAAALLRPGASKFLPSAGEISRNQMLQNVRRRDQELRHIVLEHSTSKGI